LKTNFRLVLKNDPQIVYETKQSTFLLGRSNDCDIVIEDPHISRVQAKARFENEKYYLENVGRNPIFVNGLPTQGQFLAEGDVITFGTTSLAFQPEEPTEQSAAKQIQAEKTVVLTSLPESNVTPSLILSLPTGASQTYPLEKEAFMIGRSAESDIYLEDTSISRRHCKIDKRESIYYVRNLSPTNPIFLNGEEISQKRLYKGDILRIGPFFMTYISERPLDLKKEPAETDLKETGPGWGLWLIAACLLVMIGSYLFYWRAYRPWKTEQELDSVAQQIAAEDYGSARDSLERLLLSEMGPDQSRQARELLAQTILAITQEMERTETVAAVKEFLAAHLKDYGAGREAEVLWDRMDYYRLQLGHRLESSRKFQAALLQYGAVREDGLHFNEAQKSIRKIWLALQQDRHKNQKLDRLLAEADRHFSAKRYLTPVNQNAYSIYQTILGFDPDNKIARQRVEQMKLFYRRHGDTYFNQQNWRRALTYYERYNVIDPDSRDIKKKITICRDNIGDTRARPAKPSRAQKKTDETQNQVKRLLEESGAESAWIMQYLFEEQSGETDSETPW
jgi:pSer/pThr/pTyr-binding forkhead associated (FHA) protein